MSQVLESLQQLEDVRKQNLEMAQHIQRISRMAVKSSQSVDEVSEKLTRMEEEANNQECATLLEISARETMDRIDELDVLLRQAEDDLWIHLHEGWLTQHEEWLRRLGFMEIPVLHNLFNPRVAEGLGFAEGPSEYPAYTVVEVIRRGYERHGTLWRKAQVLTVTPPKSSESGGVEQ